MSTPSPTPSPAAPAHLSRRGAEVSEMESAQAEYMLKDQCILVTRADKPTGVGASKQQCHLVTEIRAGRALHRAFSVFLFNKEGKMLLQRRAGVKPTFPRRWTNTCCSHPLFGTDEAEEKDSLGVKRAAIRKLEDELGITGIDASELHFLTKVHYCAQSDGKWGEHEIDHLMFLQRDDFPVSVLEKLVNRNEVEEVKYVSPDELRADFALAKTNPEHLTPWFQMIAEQLLFGWWEHGALERTLAAKGLGAEEAAKIRVLTLDGKPDTQIPEDTPY